MNDARNFSELISAQWSRKKFLCIGLDPGFEMIPEVARTSNIHDTFLKFNTTIIDATKHIVCAFKLNPAFYEAQGVEGWRALKDTIEYCIAVTPDVPVILDAKRGDIANTNSDYAKMAFDFFGADAVTVQPYPGGDALKPFFERRTKGIFVLVRTSNGGAGEFQDLEVRGEPLYKFVSRAAKRWNTAGNCGVVVGTTYPREVGDVRSVIDDMPILMPGIGAQGGDLKTSVQGGVNSKGSGIIVSASRAIIFASQGRDYAEAARAKAQDLHASIQNML